MTRAYYFGCIGGPGHYLHTTTLRHIYDEATLPWTRIDGVLCPGGDDGPMWRYPAPPQNQGEALLHHKDGWSALAFWDRSVDKRGGCNSVFFAEGSHDFAAMVELAKASFPTVWSRFTFEVRLAPTPVKAAS